MTDQSRPDRAEKAALRLPKPTSLPNSQTHLYVLILIAATFAAFYPSYFSKIGEAPFGFHLHAATATLWMILLAAQGWSARSQRIRVHGLLGRASLALFPSLLAGMAGVLISMNRRTVDGDKLYLIYGARISVVSAVAFLAIAGLYFGCLRNRSKIYLHSRYALSIPLLLLFSVLDRLFGWLPVPLFAGLAGFAWCVRFANGTALCFVALLYQRSTRSGLPYLLTGTVIVTQMILWEIVGTSAQMGFAPVIAGLPLVPVLASSVVIGAALAWAGWRGGKTSVM